MSAHLVANVGSSIQSAASAGVAAGCEHAASSNSPIVRTARLLTPNVARVKHRQLRVAMTGA